MATTQKSRALLLLKCRNKNQEKIPDRPGKFCRVGEKGNRYVLCREEFTFFLPLLQAVQVAV